MMVQQATAIQTKFDELAQIVPQLTQTQQWADTLQSAAQLTHQLKRQELLLETVAAISDAAGSILKVDDLLHVTVNLIRDYFDFGQVAAFMADNTGEWVELRAKANGSGDKNGPETQIRLKIGPESTLGLTMAQQKAHLNPLAEGRLEITLPLVSRGQTMGVLSLEPQTGDALGQPDLTWLQPLADQLANAIQNVRLLNENTHLLEQAENNRRFLKTVITHIPDPIFIKDKNHILLEMNQANAQVIGQPESALVGKTDRDFFSEELAQKFFQRDNEVFTHNQIFAVEDTTLWGDGQPHTAYTRLIPIPNAAGQPEYLLGITQDVTAARAREAEREQLLAETAALYQGSRAIANALSERQIFEALFEQLLRHDPCEIAAFRFIMVNDEPTWVELKSVWQKQNKPTYTAGTRFFLPDHPQARLFTFPIPLFINDLETDSYLTPPERASFTPTGARSAAILPLGAIGQLFGVVYVYFTRPYTFTEEIQRLWLAMTDQVGVALSNRQFIEEAAYRAVRMETAAEVARAASSILDLEDLLTAAVELIRNHFELYYAGAFLVDEAKEWAILKAGTGPEGRVQLQKQHRLKIGGDSMIGWSIYHRQPRIALDVGKEAVRFQNPDLPKTRSEMALPLIYHNNAIGALTIQSDEQAAFSVDDIIFLQTIADQLANAVVNARLYEKAQQEITERAKVEAALRDSQGLYASLVDTLPQNVFRKDKEGKFVFGNKRFCQSLGLSLAELIGKTDFDFYPPELAEKYRQDDLKVLKSGQIFETVEEHQLPGKEKLYVRVVKAPITDINGQPVGTQAIFWDITERRQAQEALRQSEERLELALRGADLGLWDLNQLTNEEVVDQRAAEMLGFTLDEIEPHVDWWNQRIHPDDEQRVEEAFQAHVTAQTSFYECEYRLLTKGKEWRWVLDRGKIVEYDETGQPLRLTGTYLDITERKAAEEARRASEERYRTIFEHSNDVIYITATSGEFVAINQAGLNLFGFTREEMLGLNIRDIYVDPTDRPIFRETIERDGEVRDYELKLRKKNGAVMECLINATVWRNNSGQIMGYQGIIRDMTESKRATALLAGEQSVFEMIARGAPLLEVLQALTSFIEKQSDRVFCSVMLLNQETGKLHRGAAPSLPASFIKAIDGLAIGPRAGSCGTAAYLGQQIISADIATDPLWVDYAAWIIAEYGFKACWSTPILSTQSKVMGTFAMYSQEPRSPSPSDFELIDVSVHLASIAIERKQAEEALHGSLQRTQLLYNISEALSTLINQQAAFETVLGEYLRLLNLSRGGIVLFDLIGGYNHVEALYLNGKVVPNPTIAFPFKDDMLAQHLFKNPVPLIIEGVNTHPLTQTNQAIRGQVESMLVVPLVIRGEVIGLLGADVITKGHTFSQADIEIGKAIADQLTVWLENRQLLEEARYRSSRLQTAAEVSRAASSILDTHELIDTSVNLIRDQFNFYYVGLFLVDDANEWAVLRAGTGEAGRKQIELHHRLKIEASSMIGWCIANRKARIALDVGQDAVRFQNPHLPNTHSEMALPLISRDEVIGALTVQSTEQGAFSPEDITMLQTMADQLANAIQNTTLFETVTQAQLEAELLLQETLALQAFSQTLAGTLHVKEILDFFFEACAKVMGFEYAQLSLVDKYHHRIKCIGGFGITEVNVQQASQSLDSQDIMVDIIRTGKTEVITGWDERFNRELFEAEGYGDWVRVFTPVTLRQENIGMVEAGFNKSTRGTISESQLRLLRAFIDQAALALDSAQRYEASQRAARREALIKEITTKVRASTDLETILQTTVREVGEALGSKRAYVHLVTSTHGKPESNR